MSIRIRGYGGLAMTMKPGVDTHMGAPLCIQTQYGRMRAMGAKTPLGARGRIFLADPALPVCAHSDGGFWACV